jgi:hypothetical protein
MSLFRSSLTVMLLSPFGKMPGMEGNEEERVGVSSGEVYKRDNLGAMCVQDFDRIIPDLGSRYGVTIWEFGE